MRKNFFIKLLSFVVFISLIFITVSCSHEHSGNTSETSISFISNVTFYPSNSTIPSGLIRGFKGKLLEELGISVEILSYSDEKTDAMIYSGNLPDVMVVPNSKLDSMIKENMILNLDPYLDQIPNLKNDLLRDSLQYTRQYRSNGTGKLYCLPIGVGKNTRREDTGRNALRLNWSAYEKIGAPEIKSIWDLIPIMKQMLETTPTNSEGEKCYGTFLNSGSDGTYWGNMELFFKWFGYEPTNLPYLLETDMIHGTYSSILTEDSLYYEGLKWYNTVYRNGLMDPDSINTDRLTQKTKIEKQHLAMVPSGTCAGWSPYYLQYWLPETTLYAEQYSSPYGNSQYSLVISAKSKNIEGSLVFLNALSDPDFLLTTKCGPKGDAWYEKDGITYISDEMLECAINGTPYILNGTGERIENWGIEFVVSSDIPSSYIGPDGNVRPSEFTSWKEVVDARNNNAIYRNWKKTLDNCNDFTSYLEEHDAYQLESRLDYLEYFTSSPSQELQSKIDIVKNIVVNASWQMVYADSETEFQSVWDKMVSDCKKSGAEEIIEWRTSELENAIATKDSLR